MNFDVGDVEDDLHQLEAEALRAQEDDPPAVRRRVVRDRINLDFPVLEDFRYDIFESAALIREKLATRITINCNK